MKVLDRLSGTKASLYNHFQPELNFVGLFDNNSQFRGHIRFTAGPTGRAVVRPDRGTTSNQLISDRRANSVGREVRREKHYVSSKVSRQFLKLLLIHRGTIYLNLKAKTLNLKPQNLFPVTNSYAWTYLARVFATTSGGRVGPGGCLFQFKVSR